MGSEQSHVAARKTMREDLFHLVLQSPTTASLRQGAVSPRQVNKHDDDDDTVMMMMVKISHSSAQERSSVSQTGKHHDDDSDNNDDNDDA